MHYAWCERPPHGLRITLADRVTHSARNPSFLRALPSCDGRSPENLPKDQVHSLIYTLRWAALEAGQGMPKVALAKVELPQPATTFVRRTRPTMTVGDKTYTLVLGDCHRHTDIRGHSGVDGSLMDTYRPNSGSGSTKKSSPNRAKSV